MNDTRRYGERTIALALLGAVLFSVPVLNSFGAAEEHLLFGIPALYLYLFVAWALLIGLLALVMESSRGGNQQPAAPPADRERDGRDSV
ncbi:MAG: hypothetical protein QNJ67_03850 [Kiloniellales bacterium]|nr:hypothetical protein [Kiloniellales bacterium]